jgi:hypothetical protein|tara:strand:- start:355 stop:681 length:327 start_codon:yes stop_codon:yes gene_type:complete
MDYIPIPKGAQPPLLKFETDTEFHQELSKHEHAIHTRTLYSIGYALNTEYDDEITIAFLNDEDTILGCPPDVWVDNLEMTLDYFISIEDYEKCQEVKELLDKIKNEKL